MINVCSNVLILPLLWIKQIDYRLHSFAPLEGSVKFFPEASKQFIHT